MGIEKALTRLRWFVLGSLLLILSVMQLENLRMLLFVVSAGILYNLALTVIPRTRLDVERLKGINTLFDGAALFAIVALTAGLNSLFFIYLAVFVFSVSLRYTIKHGLAAAFLTSAALSFFYFTNPTTANGILLASRAIIFFLAAVAAVFLQAREEFLVPAPPAEKAEEIEEVEEAVESEEVEAAEFEEEVEEKIPERVVEEIAEDIPAKVLKEVSEIAKVEEKPREEASELKQRLTELAVLHEASKALGASLILEDVLGTAADIATKGLMADVAGALVFSAETGLLVVGALRGFTAEEREVLESTTFTPGEGILGECYTIKKTVNIEDISAGEKAALPFDGRIKSFLATPLATDGYEVGVLFLAKFIKEPFQKDAEEFIETIAGQTAIAIENAKLYEQAQDLAIHDGLTGIYNYRYFMRQLDEEFKRAERYHRSVSLIMIDIDLFKRVNDTYGHQVGDEALQGMAKTLQQSTRETDTVARYGGEEFAVILPEASMENALEVASKLRQAVAKSEYAKKKDRVIKITISLGVATYPSSASNQEELLRLADDALYSAKEQRDTICSAENTHLP